ncbi:hypothetical protein [Pseudidiomarina aestuarii]|uniref:hypothetical protein n=1 Tax=Pseudidiomarina aestuarii TaxID=624146 RepID=UPI003A96E3FC
MEKRMVAEARLKDLPDDLSFRTIKGYLAEHLGDSITFTELSAMSKLSDSLFELPGFDNAKLLKLRRLVEWWEKVITTDSVDSEAVAPYSYMSDLPFNNRYQGIRNILTKTFDDYLTYKQVRDLSEGDLAGIPDFGSENLAAFFEMMDWWEGLLGLTPTEVRNISLLVEEPEVEEEPVTSEKPLAEADNNKPYETNDEQNLLADTPGDPRYETLKNYLFKIFGERVTYEELRDMDEGQLLDLGSFGLRKLRRFREMLLWWEEFTQSKKRAKQLGKSSNYLNELIVEPKYIALQNALIRNLGPEITFEQLDCMTDGELLLLGSISAKKLTVLKQLLEEWPTLPEYRKLDSDDDYQATESLEKNENFHHSDEFFNASVDSLILNEKEQRHLDYAKSILGDSASVRELLALNIRSMEGLHGFGKLKRDFLINLIERIAHGDVLAERTTTNEKQAAGGAKFNSDSLDLEHAERTLIHRLETYTEALTSRDRYIWNHRLGYKAPHLTLEEIGSSLPSGAITRERVRQLESRILKNWVSRCSLSPSRLWFTVQEHLSLLKSTLMPQLRESFSSELAFFDFLAATCNKQQVELRDVLSPEIPILLVKKFWAYNKSPALISELTDFLIEEKGYGGAVADNVIFRGIEQKKLIKYGDFVSPVDLPQAIAIANTLLEIPAGACWQQIHKRVNEKGISQKELPEDRLNQSITTAQNAGYIYQSGRGEYRHSNYLELIDEDINKVLADLAAVLWTAKANGRNTLHLVADFYNKRNLNLDYFEVRHIARAYGERKGIFFSGTSGADIVSLDVDFSII